MFEKKRGNFAHQCRTLAYFVTLLDDTGSLSKCVITAYTYSLKCLLRYCRKLILPWDGVLA